MSLTENSGLISLEEGLELREALHRRGERLVVTNGCFDLLHPGHINYLQKSRSLGDQLWILLNSDLSVKALKGDSRPILSEAHRAYFLSALSCVDQVIVFRGARMDQEIRALAPDLYTKAGDYTLETLDPGERTALESVGAEIMFLPFWEGFSTSKMIERIKASL